mgnify:CR=1 FL=1
MYYYLNLCNTVTKTQGNTENDVEGFVLLTSPIMERGRTRNITLLSTRCTGPN